MTVTYQLTPNQLATLNQFRALHSYPEAYNFLQNIANQAVGNASNAQAAADLQQLIIG